MLTRETGGTPVGDRLRAILHDTTVTDLADRAEALITAADRAQHIAHVVRPALAAGRTVVSDRSVLLDARLPGLRPRASTSTSCGGSTTGRSTGCGPTGWSCWTRPPTCWPQRIGDRDLDRFEQAGATSTSASPPGFRAMAAADPRALDRRRRRR